MAAARVQAERRFLGLWAAAAKVETPTPVTLAARPGFGISRDSWRIAIGDPYRARVTEFTEWLSALDPDGVSQRGGDDGQGRRSDRAGACRRRLSQDQDRRGRLAPRRSPRCRGRAASLGPYGRGLTGLRALDNCESFLDGVRSVLEPFDVRTLVEDMF